jgi:hypothetical protein
MPLRQVNAQAITGAVLSQHGLTAITGIHQRFSATIDATTAALRGTRPYPTPFQC